MQINFLKNVVEEIAGKQAREIVEPLLGKKDVNEFLIAKKLKLTINQTRNILYRLFEKGLVSFTKKKDKRKGWFIYFWTLNSLKSLDLSEKKTLEEIKQATNQLKNRKTKRFYFCKTCNVEVGEETALLNNFTCQECGEVYSLVEQNKVIKELENKIVKLEKQLKTIREEKEKLSEEKKKVKKKRGKEKKRKKRKKTKRKLKKKANKIKKRMKKKAKKRKKS